MVALYHFISGFLQANISHEFLSLSKDRMKILRTKLSGYLMSYACTLSLVAMVINTELKVYKMINSFKSNVV